MQIVHQFNSKGKEYMSLITPVCVGCWWVIQTWMEKDNIIIHLLLLSDFYCQFCNHVNNASSEIEWDIVDWCKFFNLHQWNTVVDKHSLPLWCSVTYSKIWWTIINSIVQLISLNQWLQQNWIFVMYFKVWLFTVPTLWITGTVAYNYKNIMNNGQ